MLSGIDIGVKIFFWRFFLINIVFRIIVWKYIIVNFWFEINVKVWYLFEVYGVVVVKEYGEVSVWRVFYVYVIDLIFFVCFCCENFDVV